MDAIGWAGRKSSTYRDAQAAGEAVRRIRQAQGERKVLVAGADTTFVVCDQEQVTIFVGVDALTQGLLKIELVDAESIEALRPFIEGMVDTFEVQVLLSDDQDSCKRLADDLAIQHGIGKAHVNRNIAQLVAALAERALDRPDPLPPGLVVTIDDFLADLEYA